MGQLQEDTQEKINKPFETFLSFVAFTLTIRLLPLFESFTSNIALQIIVGLSFVGIIIKLFIDNRKLPYILRKNCERLNVSLTFLYIAYIILYFVVALVIM